ncbi:tRNA wybutosine-synthesizing protein 4-like [Dermacentor andersoni]|uniref:tRNA wybutosine-synthesizing protein 4-like n=1 Tax=Dermacentor andersoni TaxID=34620 RepID=UPI002155B367|nr:tRNA wybutosine-synthesizing protein 4-like [Dermacentor andersoni]
MTKKDKQSSVQRTNDSSIVSKCSMASKGYVTDDFTRLFVAKCARRSPLINRGYYVRAKCMSQLFKDYCGAFRNHTCQVLSLGAGYDANFFKLKAAGTLPVNCRYFEVDLPLVVANKKDIIESSTELRSLVNAAVTSGHQPQYCLLGQDIRDLDRLESALRAVGLDFRVPTLVFAECVLSYLDTKHSDRLVQWTSSTFEDVALAVYEQVEPHDAFGIVMLKHFESLGSPLKSLREYPTVASLRSRYLARGYEACDCVSLAEFVGALDAKEALRFQGLEPFDEFEEWLQKCAHYAFAVSRKGSAFEAFLTTGFAQRGVACAPRNSTLQLGRVDWTLHSADSSLRRFGHSSALTTDGRVITAGGFAENGGKHSRVFEPVLTDPTTFQSELISARLEGRQHFAMLCLDNGCVLVNGGRTSPLRACGADIVLTPSSGSYVAENSHFALTPPARWRHTLAKLRSAEGREKVVLFGGRTPRDAALSDTYVLDVTQCSWSKVPEGVVWPVSRHSHAAVSTADQSSMIVTCGLSSSEKPLNCVYSFDIATLTWGEIPVDGLLPRFGHTAHLTGLTTVVLIGGVSGRSGEPCGLAIIDLVSMTCREVSLPEQNPERPFMTFGHSSVLIEDSDKSSSILIVGGGGNCFSFGTHFNHHVASIDLRRLLECEM